jgi:hypothetical protein
LCSEYHYYPDLEESLPVAETRAGGGKPNGGGRQRNPWVFIEVEKLLGSTTMGLEMSVAEGRRSGRKKSRLSQPKTYSIDQETLDTLMEAGDDFERIHEANAEI